MLEVTQDKAKAGFQKKFPTRKIEWVTHDGNHWYVFAPDTKDDAEGSLNPYFKVDDSTGEVSEFYIVQNFPLFNKLVDQVAKSRK